MVVGYRGLLYALLLLAQVPLACSFTYLFVNSKCETRRDYLSGLCGGTNFWKAGSSHFTNFSLVSYWFGFPALSMLELKAVPSMLLLKTTMHKFASCLLFWLSKAYIGHPAAAAVFGSWPYLTHDNERQLASYGTTMRLHGKLTRKPTSCRPSCP